jgi:tetratricopeptide (TPR) repeat protein
MRSVWAPSIVESPYTLEISISTIARRLRCPRWVEAEPDYYWAIKTLCDWFHEEKAHDKALFWAPKLVRLAPEDAVAHAYIGHALEASDRKAEACENDDRAFQIDPTYTFAGFSLIDLPLELGEYDLAADNLKRLHVHLLDCYTLGREVHLESTRGNLDRAFEVHAEICRGEEVSQSTLGWIDAALDDAADSASITLRYEKIINRGGVAESTVARWISRALEAGLVSVYKRFPLVLGPESPLRETAWCAYFESMGGRTVSDSVHGEIAIREHRDELRKSTEIWEQVGY